MYTTIMYVHMYVRTSPSASPTLSHESLAPDLDLVC